MDLSIKNKDVVSSINFALFVGTILNFVNQFQPLISLDASEISFVKIILTYSVPFFVSLVSSTLSNRNE